MAYIDLCNYKCIFSYTEHLTILESLWLDGNLNFQQWVVGYGGQKILEIGWWDFFGENSVEKI